MVPSPVLDPHAAEGTGHGIQGDTHTPVPSVPAGAHGMPVQPALRGDVGG